MNGAFSAAWGSRAHLRVRDHSRTDVLNPEAKQLHAEDHAIRTEERAMAGFDGGHFTRAEQRALNQQENAVSRQIGP